MTLTEPSAKRGSSWITLTLIGIVLATFFSDVSHEMCTAVLPMYLTAVGLGPAALGLIEGLADFLVSVAKLAGGVLGHYVERKRSWAALGYLVTALGTSGIGFAGSLVSILTLRCLAWIGRGFRAPLRDFLLADAVHPQYFGRAYGLERAGDMLGAVVGPLLAMVLLGSGLGFRIIILWSIVPGLLAAGAFYFLTCERREKMQVPQGEPAHTRTVQIAAPVNHRRGTRAALPGNYWKFLVGVFLFGLGDFSRTFLIWLVAQAVETKGGSIVGTISLPALLYLCHNLVSALVAYPVGLLGDRQARFPVLVLGYALGVGTNLLLALTSSSLPWLVVAIVLSGTYIAIQETLEKAVAAELLSRELRSFGFGILASSNAVGDMVSSLYVGLLLESGHPAAAFGVAGLMGIMGLIWMLWVCRKRDSA